MNDICTPFAEDVPAKSSTASSIHIYQLKWPSPESSGTRESQEVTPTGFEVIVGLRFMETGNDICTPIAEDVPAKTSIASSIHSYQSKWPSPESSGYTRITEGDTRPSRSHSWPGVQGDR